MSTTIDRLPATGLHCPRCGDIMTESAHGGLECVRGRMELSGALERRLTECYIDCARRPDDRTFSSEGKPHGIGGSWFCPGCGIAARESTPGDLRCPVCSRSLVEFVRDLVELHPHT